MNHDIHPKSSNNQQPDTDREGAHRSTFALKQVTDAVGDLAGEVTVATKDATEAAKDIYQSAKCKAGEALATSKGYVRRNPVPVILGAVAFGAALGCLVMMARRKQTFGERYADEPMVAVREALLGALAPVTQRVHKGYDSARDGAGKVMDRVYNFGTGRTSNSLSDQIGRIGNNLKFW